MTLLRAFQKRFIKAATAPGIDTAAMSLPGLVILLYK